MPGVVFAHCQGVGSGGQPLVVPEQEILGLFVGGEIGGWVVPGASFQGHHRQARLGQPGQQRRTTRTQANHHAINFVGHREQWLQLLLRGVGGGWFVGASSARNRRVLHFGRSGGKYPFFQYFFRRAFLWSAAF